MERQKVLSVPVPSTAETNLSVEGQDSAGCAPRGARSKASARGRGRKAKVLAFGSVPEKKPEQFFSDDEYRTLDAGIDVVLVEELKRVSLCGGLTVALFDASLMRRILPRRILNAVVIGRLLLKVVVEVKKIQWRTGVRASVLLAEFEFIRNRPAPEGFCSFLRDGEPLFGFDEALEAHALRMKKDSRFQAVLRATDDQLLKEMKRCGFWSARDAKDRVDFISRYDLQEYDIEVGTYEAEDGA